MDCFIDKLLCNSCLCLFLERKKLGKTLGTKVYYTTQELLHYFSVPVCTFQLVWSFSGLIKKGAELQNVSTLAGRGSPNPVFAFWVKFEIIHKGCKLFVGGEGGADYVVV